MSERIYVVHVVVVVVVEGLRKRIVEDKRSDVRCRRYTRIYAYEYMYDGIVATGVKYAIVDEHARMMSGGGYTGESRVRNAAGKKNRAN